MRRTRSSAGGPGLLCLFLLLPVLGFVSRQALTGHRPGAPTPSGGASQELRDMPGVVSVAQGYPGGPSADAFVRAGAGGDGLLIAARRIRDGLNAGHSSDGGVVYVRVFRYSGAVPVRSGGEVGVRLSTERGPPVWRLVDRGRFVP